jgi:hypothetical protein
VHLDFLFRRLHERTIQVLPSRRQLHDQRVPPHLLLLLLPPDSVVVGRGADWVSLRERCRVRLPARRLVRALLRRVREDAIAGLFLLLLGRERDAGADRVRARERDSDDCAGVHPAAADADVGRGVARRPRENEDEEDEGRARVCHGRISKVRKFEAFEFKCCTRENYGEVRQIWGNAKLLILLCQEINGFCSNERNESKIVSA